MSYIKTLKKQLINKLEEDILERYSNSEYWDQDIIDNFTENLDYGQVIKLNKYLNLLNINIELPINCPNCRIPLEIKTFNRDSISVENWQCLACNFIGEKYPFSFL